MERCEGETRRWSTAEQRPFRSVSADKNLRVGRTEKEEERKLREAEVIGGERRGGGGARGRKGCLKDQRVQKEESDATVAGSKT